MFTVIIFLYSEVLRHSEVKYIAQGNKLLKGAAETGNLTPGSRIVTSTFDYLPFARY